MKNVNNVICPNCMVPVRYGASDAEIRAYKDRKLARLSQSNRRVALGRLSCVCGHPGERHFNGRVHKGCMVGGCGCEEFLCR